MEQIKMPAGEALTPDDGLSEREAEERLSKGMGNVSADGGERTVGQILLKNLCTFFNLINVLLGIALAAVGSFRNMMFLGTVLANTVFSTVQELRARRTLNQLRLMNETPVKVIRSGKETAVSPRKIVRGDLIRLAAGDQVPADCLVRSGDGAANEALLTGESDSVPRHPGEFLLSGSYISAGSLTAQCVFVGADSYASQLTKEARTRKSGKSILMDEMNRLIRLITVAMLPLGIALFVRQYFISGDPLKDCVVSAVGAMVGMIPNGLMLLISMALTVGVIRLGRRHTLVQELYGIEALARADVLCLDKTGTLTTGKMKTEAFVCVEAKDEAQLKAQFARFIGTQKDLNATSSAISACVGPGNENAAGVMPFSSERKYAAASFKDGTALIMGAPDRVWKGDLPEEAAERIDAETRRGSRVIGLFAAEGAVDDTHCPGAKALLGLAVLSDEVRPEAAETLHAFHERGVDIRVISGDDPRTVSYTAAALGIEGAERFADVSALEDDQLAGAVENCRVFGRVTPERKCEIVKMLKNAGHSVAMTGDGVNDIPAMKASDCSIAMASGSDATRHAAMVTLMNSDFSAMPAIVGEGRRVVNNVTRAASLFLVKTLYSLGLSLIMLFLPLAYPFQPIQLTLISALTIGVPGIFLALEPNAEPIRGRFLRTVLRRALPGSIGVMVAALGSMFLSKFGFDKSDCSCVAAFCAGMAGITMLTCACLPLNRRRACLIAAMLVMLLGAMFLLGDVFRIRLFILPAPLLAACGIGAVVCILCIVILNRIFSRSEMRILEKIGL